MKSFRNYISEEVLPTAQVADGGMDISKAPVRAAINRSEEHTSELQSH